MKSKNLLSVVLLIAGLFLSTAIFAQEPDVNNSNPEPQGGKQVKKEKKHKKDDKSRGNSKTIGEPIPGSDIYLEQEPEEKQQNSGTKKEEPVIDDMMLEDDK